MKLLQQKKILLTEANKLNNIQSKICVIIKYVYRINQDPTWHDQEVGLLVTKKDGKFSFDYNPLIDGMICDPNLFKIGM